MIVEALSSVATLTIVLASQQTMIYLEGDDSMKRG